MAIRLGGSDAVSDRHCLYRAYDAAGALLYVGISLQGTRRLSDHRRASGWFRETAWIRIERFATRAEVLVAETVAIRREKPKYNVAQTVAARTSKTALVISAIGQRDPDGNPTQFVTRQELAGILEVRPARIGDIISSRTFPRPVRFSQSERRQYWRLHEVLQWREIERARACAPPVPIDCKSTIFGGSILPPEP